MAAHESARTTGLYDRRGDEISLGFLHAAIVNIGFETGDFTGWSTFGKASITQKFSANAGDVFRLYELLLTNEPTGVGVTSREDLFFIDIRQNGGAALQRGFAPTSDIAFIPAPASTGFITMLPNVLTQRYSIPQTGMYRISLGVVEEIDANNTTGALWNGELLSATVPEPGSLILASIGLLALCMRKAHVQNLFLKDVN